MKYGFEIHGMPGSTERVVCYDVAGQMNESYYTRNGHIAIAMTLTAEVKDVRIAFGGSIPNQNIQPLGHTLIVGTFLRIANPTAIQTLRFINAVNGADAVLVVTPEYEVGV